MRPSTELTALLNRAESKDADDLYELGLSFYGGDAEAELDLDSAMLCWRRSAELGNIKAKATLGSVILILLKAGECPGEYVEAGVAFTLEAAEAGDVQSMLAAGIMYQDAIAVDLDLEKARTWFLRASEAGNARGLDHAGWIAREQGDYVLAHSLFRKAADRGDAHGMFHLGGLYQIGLGVYPNAREAERWYRLGGAAGDADAKFNLGWMYAMGDGVPQSYGEAVRWYREAAALGNVDAMVNLGCLLTEGRGCRRDPVEARRWMVEAFSLGSAAAAMNLAQGYEQGLQCERSIEKAIELYTWALQAGFEKAQGELERLLTTGGHGR
jgi:TPR repeat protein